MPPRFQVDDSHPKHKQKTLKLTGRCYYVSTRQLCQCDPWTSQTLIYSRTCGTSCRCAQRFTPVFAEPNCRRKLDARSSKASNNPFIWLYLGLIGAAHDVAWLGARLAGVHGYRRVAFRAQLHRRRRNMAPHQPHRPTGAHRPHQHRAARCSCTATLWLPCPVFSKRRRR